MSVEVRTTPTPRPVAVGDVIVSKPFGSGVAARGQVHLVTESTAYFRCAPRACRGCRAYRSDPNMQGTHKVRRTWLDWYRESHDDREIQASLADRKVRVWDAGAKRYVDADADLRPIEQHPTPGVAS